MARKIVVDSGRMQLESHPLRYALLLCLLVLPVPAQAGPIHWLKQHPKTSKLIAAGIAAGVHARGLAHCRQGNVEHCDGGYGEAWAIFGISTGLNLVAIPISEQIGGKTGDAISYGGSALQLSHGIVEWRSYKPEKNVDLSHVTFTPQ